MVGILATDFCFVLSIIIFLYQKYRLVTFVIYSCWNLKYTSFFLTCVGCFVFDTRKSPELPTFWVFYKAFVSLRESRSLLGFHYHSWTLLTVIRWQVFNMYYNCVIIMYNNKFHKQGLTGVKHDINYLYFFSFSF